MTAVDELARGPSRHAAARGARHRRHRAIAPGVLALIALAAATASAGPTPAPATPAALATLGNAWHLAASVEPTATMRAPLRPAASTAIVIVNGNQYRGPGGTPGNQLQTGSALLFRSIHATAWTAVPMTFVIAAGNNKYFQAAIPAAAVIAGDTLEYYLRIAYSDHATTYVFGDDASSRTSADEGLAQASPFALSIPWPDAPSGRFLSFRRPGDVVEARVAEASGHVSIVGPDRQGVTMTITLRPPTARIDDRWLGAGRVVSSTPRSDGLELRQELGRRVITARLTMDPARPGIVHYAIVDWGGSPPTETAVDAPSPAGEHFYGLGEKFNSLDQTGKRVHILTSDAPGDKGDRSYKVAPWFVSTRGYGFRLDSTAESFFDLRQAAPDRWAVQHLFATLAYDIIYGPQLTDVVARFVHLTGALTGRAARPPEWVFGPWMSSDIWRDGGEVRYVVTKMIERGIPASVFVFDSPWEVAYNDFTWNLQQFGRGGRYEGQDYPGFASVSEMMAFLRGHGLKVVVWLTPFLDVESFDEGVVGQNLGRSALYDEAAAKGYLVRSSPGGAPLVVTWWKGKGSAVDFTNPAARAWFAAKLRALVDESDGVISGFKIDDGEADYIPTTAAYFDGRTGVEMRNGYTVEYHRAVGAVLGAEGVLFARSGYTGTQGFPASWAGDNEPNFGDGNGLPSVIIAGLSAAMSGYAFWAHDVGGYQDSNLSRTPANLFMRWAQFGALSPIMQMHRQVRLGLQYPWSYGDDALANYRAYAQLHTALFPYLYAAADDAARTGVPILRPLVMIHPDDPATYGVNHTYYLGDDLIVAPIITNEATERRLYLPAGTWIDYWTDQPVDGGRIVTWQSADQQRVPLYVRAGAVLPMLLGAPQTLAPAAYVGDPAITTAGTGLELRVYPPAAGAVPTRRLVDGTVLAATRDGSRITVDVDGPARELAVRVLAGGARAVTFRGRALPARTAATLAQATSGWVQDGAWVRIKAPHPGGAGRVAITVAATATRALAIDEPASTDGGCASGGSPSSALPLALVAIGALVRRRVRRQTL